MAKKSQNNKRSENVVSKKIVRKVALAPPLPYWVGSDWLFGLILFLAVVVIYQPVWYAGFIWDDDLILTANPVIVGPLGLKEIWTTNAADICPLTLTTFWMEHALWGVAPLPYHLVNVVMHGASAVVFWRVLRCLQIPGAWLGTALWALHPVQVESAAWITEMKNTQSGLFYLLSILFFVRWLGTRENLKTSDGNYILALLFAALAMASKSSTVILPVVLCLCAWWVEGRWHWRNLLRVVPVILMSIAAAAVSMWTQGLQLATAVDPQWGRTWPERLAAAGDAVWFYLGKLIWPYPLITIYPRWQIDASQWLSYLPLLAVIGVLFILWLKRESWGRPWFFAFAYFMVALLPVLGLLDNTIFRYSLVFDHFQYLASMGPLALAGAGLARFLDYALSGKPWLRSSLYLAICLILGTLSWQRAWVYENHQTLWTDTLAKNPNCWAGYDSLGVALFQMGRVDEAMTQYQKGLEINPNDAEAYSNLGYALLKLGQVDEAATHFQKSLKLDPNFARSHNGLGNALVQKGRIDEAMAQFQMALKINPNLAGVQFNLGNAFSQKGQLNEAIVEYRKALVIDPKYVDAHNGLGVALAKIGQLDEAIAQFQEALRLNPDDKFAKENLAHAEALLQHR